MVTITELLQTFGTASWLLAAWNNLHIVRWWCQLMTWWFPVDYRLARQTYSCTVLKLPTYSFRTVIDFTPGKCVIRCHCVGPSGCRTASRTTVRHCQFENKYKGWPRRRSADGWNLMKSMDQARQRGPIKWDWLTYSSGKVQVVTKDELGHPTAKYWMTSECYAEWFVITWLYFGLMNRTCVERHEVIRPLLVD